LLVLSGNQTKHRPPNWKMDQDAPPTGLHRLNASTRFFERAFRNNLTNQAAAFSLHRRRLGTLILASLLIIGSSAFASRNDESDFRSRQNQSWVGTWGTGPAGLASDSPAPQFANQTLRLIVHTSLGGSKLRIRFSNAYGTDPVVIGETHVAIRASGSMIVAGSDRLVTFSGRQGVTIPVGAIVLSDAVDLRTPSSGDLAVSIYLPNVTPASTDHTLALQTSYVSTPGNFTAALVLPPASTITTWPFLTGVDVATSDPVGAIVAFGDSITDGAASTIDTNRRWPNFLANRLLAAHLRLAVLNEGIIGNRILHPGFPPTQPFLAQRPLSDLTAMCSARQA
jgi:hypothetical protein